MYEIFHSQVEKILSSQHLRKLNMVIERTGSTWVRKERDGVQIQEEQQRRKGWKLEEG